jgi:hypothetical protein
MPDVILKKSRLLHRRSLNTSLGGGMLQSADEIDQTHRAAGEPPRLARFPRGGHKVLAI